MERDTSVARSVPAAASGWSLAVSMVCVAKTSAFLSAPFMPFCFSAFFAALAAFFFAGVSKPRWTSTTEPGSTRYWIWDGSPFSPPTVPRSSVNATTPPFAIFESRASAGFAPLGRNSRKKDRKKRLWPPTTMVSSGRLKAHSAKACMRCNPLPRSNLLPLLPETSKRSAAARCDGTFGSTGGLWGGVMDSVSMFVEISWSAERQWTFSSPCASRRVRRPSATVCAARRRFDVASTDASRSAMAATSPAPALSGGKAAKTSSRSLACCNPDSLSGLS
mmetsp:Transcript_22079/g.71462  ORF Transcript_22079/g.71462 Transcript_22079/m.71462 type:complete len:277 (+) Transcript_22079:195-1025(+)